MPLFFLNDVSAAFFPPMALAFGAAIVASAVISVTLAPALALVLFPAEPRQHRSPLLARSLRTGYERSLAWVLGRAGCANRRRSVLVLVGLGLLTQVSQPTLLPSVKERNLLVHWDGPAGASRSEMVRMVSRAANEIEAIPGVIGVGSHVGRAITSDQVVGMNSGEIWIQIAPDADYDATLGGDRSDRAPTPASSRVSTPIRRRE